MNATAARAAEQLERRTQALLTAIEAISAAPYVETGAITCPLCGIAGGLRFRAYLSTGRGIRRCRGRLLVQAKCTTPDCLEFRS